MCARKADPPEIRAIKEGKIKQAAIKFFSEKGFHAATTGEITEAAGIAKGTLYWYFNTKEDLAFALVSDMLDEFKKLVEEIRDAKGSATARFRKLAVRAAELYEQEKAYCRLLWKFRADQHYVFSPDYVQKVRTYYDAILKALADIIDQGIRSGEFRRMNSRHWAFVILGITEGLELEWLENEDEFDMGKAFREMMEMLLAHFRKAPGKGRA